MQNCWLKIVVVILFLRSQFRQLIFSFKKTLEKLQTDRCSLKKRFEKRTQIDGSNWKCSGELEDKAAQLHEKFEETLWKITFIEIYWFLYFLYLEAAVYTNGRSLIMVLNM